MQALCKISYVFVCLLSFTLLQGCLFKAKPLPARFNIVYIASEQLNPDINGRPSPLVVTTCQLKSTTTFKNADFFALFNNLKATLTDELVHQEETEVQPKQQITINQDVLPEARYFAIFGAYRDLSNSNWRTLIDLKRIKKERIKIRLGETGIEVIKK